MCLIDVKLSVLCLIDHYSIPYLLKFMNILNTKFKFISNILINFFKKKIEYILILYEKSLQTKLII